VHAGTAPLIHIWRDQEGVQSLIGQQVLQDRHPGHRQPVVGTKVLGQWVFQRQVHAGAVHSQQAQALPGLVQPQLIHLGLQGAVESLKDGRAELLSGFAEGLGGDHLGFKGGTIEGLKEGIQFGLQGAVGLIEQKQDQTGEGQMAFAGKVLRMGAMLGNKLGVAQ